MKSLGFTLLFLAAGLGGVSAQVSGVVTDGEDVGVNGVWVEVWGSGARLAAVVTNESGAFSFQSLDRTQVSRISFSHIAYETVVIDPDGSPEPLRVVLNRRALALPELTVVVAQERCPTQDHPGARELWRAASERYSDHTAGRGQAAWILSTSNDVMDYEIGRYSSDELQEGEHYWVGAVWPPEPGRYETLDSIIARQGYASRHRGSTTGRRSLNWVYPELEGRYAHHFQGELFGRLHNFAFVDSNRDVHVIAFCPRDQDQPTISGVIRISSDTTLLEARWRFQTPEPVEDAGAEVVFTSFREHSSDRPHLMAARGLFWRHDGREPPFPNAPRSYFQRVQIRTSWAVGSDAQPPDVVPWRKSEGGSDGPNG